MDIIKTELILRSYLRQVTPLIPEILFRENSKNIIITFKENIPDEKTTIEIEKILNKFGETIPNHCREYSFISFLILR